MIRSVELLADAQRAVEVDAGRSQSTGIGEGGMGVYVDVQNLDARHTVHVLRRLSGDGGRSFVTLRNIATIPIARDDGSPARFWHAVRPTFTPDTRNLVDVSVRVEGPAARWSVFVDWGADQPEVLAEHEARETLGR